MSKTNIFLQLVLISVLLFGFTEALEETQMYKKLLTRPEFKPCDPFGCGIDQEGDSTPICGKDGQCKPCQRNGECVMAYRVYLDEVHIQATCNRATGVCERPSEEQVQRRGRRGKGPRDEKRRR